MAKKRKQSDLEREALPSAGTAKEQQGEQLFKNKEKVLILSTRGITFRCVHAEVCMAMGDKHACK
jgi:hypothetical protein